MLNTICFRKLVFWVGNVQKIWFLNQELGISESTVKRKNIIVFVCFVLIPFFVPRLPPNVSMSATTLSPCQQERFQKIKKNTKS